MIDQPEIYKEFLENIKNLNPEDIAKSVDIAGANYGEIFEDQKKLTEAPHEIVVKINANVLEQNEKGEYIGSKGMFEQNYHIPVPTGVLYKNYVDSFFEFVKKALVDTIENTENKIG